MPADTHETLETESGEEIKTFRIFIYNRDFDSERLRIVDYNEDWATIQRKHRGKHVMYPGRGNESTIIENWRNSTEVKLLAYTVTKEFAGKGMGEEEALQLNWKNLRIIIPVANDVDIYINKYDDFKWIEIAEEVEEKMYLKK